MRAVTHRPTITLQSYLCTQHARVSAVTRTKHKGTEGEGGVPQGPFPKLPGKGRVPLSPEGPEKGPVEPPTRTPQRCREKGTLLHCWWECKLIQPLERSEWRFLKKLEINLPYNPTIPLLGIYPKETIIEKGACTPVFIAALFAIARTFKQPKCPLTDEWIKKLWYIHSMEYYSAIKRNACDSVLTRWMN